MCLKKVGNAVKDTASVLKSRKEKAMIRIAVCDDEKKHLDKIKALLEQYAEEKGLLFDIYAFSSPSDLLDKIESGETYSIYILDIYMPGITGMSVATELRGEGVEAPIIFLTSSPDFALQAFGVNATHYILKPYDKESVFFAIDKALHEIGVMRPEGIMLRIDGGYRNIPARSIIFSEADDNYQRIHLVNEKYLYIRITMGELYEQLSSLDGFFKLGRSHIVNLKHVVKFTANKLLMTGGTELTVPKGALADFKTAYFDYFSTQTNLS